MKNQIKFYFLLALMIIVPFGMWFLSFLWVGSFDPDSPFSFDEFFSTENLLFAGIIVILIGAIAFLFKSNKDTADRE